ncbi:HD domain-containing protein [Methylobacterium sp. WSM2598]|uniref:HD domain-containing protein n=1 Tax=Methylobacterium sp. WSM2598 TaxID=398261 RepID=UPI00035E8F2C|nr:HD domain-containing protein [Methylobacterium sp. WSM2598]
MTRADHAAFAAAFSPFADLAAALAPHLPECRDGSHDLAHLVRVWRNLRRIREREGGDPEILAAACLLHDCVAVEKDAPDRADASRRAAARASALLATRGWPAPRIGAVAHAVEAHSFSAGIPPATIEAMILQDADRLDALGAVGVARCFYVAGRIGSALYDSADPDARRRPRDDRRFALDHFETKLLRLATGFQTATGRSMAAARHAEIARFLAAFRAEIGVAGA